jgi:hypothetical protein
MCAYLDLLAIKMIRRRSISAPLTLLIASVNSALAVTSPIGEAMNVVPAVTSTGENGNVTLSAGATVFQDDLVKTGALGRAGLQFLDETKLEVGPNSSAKLDRFVFNPDKTASEASISLAKGIFRFVSGGHNKPNTYTITTPHATLGIRGTAIRMTITQFRTDIVVEEGFVDACSTKGGGCKQLSPGLASNAGTFTLTGFVRDFASQSNGSIQGVGTTGAMPGARGAGSLTPSETGGQSGDASNVGDTSTIVSGGTGPILGTNLDLQDGSRSGVDPIVGSFSIDSLQAPRDAASPTLPDN